MSVRTDIINLVVNVNGNKAQNELNNLRKKAADIKFEMQGLTKGTKDYISKKAELNQVTASMDALKKQIGLAALSQKELVRELSTLKSLRGSVTPFSDEYNKLDASIKKVEARLYNVKNGVQGFSSFLSKIKDEVKQFGVVAAGYLGFQFITSQFQNMIRGAGKMSDSLADIQRVTGMTSDSVKNLNSSLKEIDTRTTTQGLREIAIIAGKLGVASEDILEFTKATDMLVVALGDELGDASQITTELGKILNVFDGEVTGDNISKLGNAMVELANAGVASGSYIADFTQRVAAITKIAGMSLGEVTGLAAAMEELGLRSESSSTAIQKLLSTIAADLPKAAKISGVGLQEFTDLFAKAPGEALIKFAEGLSKNKESFAEVSAAFKDAGEEGARVVTVLSTIGEKGDLVRKRMLQGSEAIQKTTAITEAFNLKNNTLGASLDKLSKEFNRLVESRGFVKFIESATTGLLNFMRALRSMPWPVTTAALTALTLVVIAYTAAKVKAFIATTRLTVAELASATAKKASAIATALLQSAQALQIITTDLLAKRITILTAVQRAWNVVMSLGAGGIGVLIAAATALTYGIATMVSKTKELTTALKVESEVKSKITELTGEEEATSKRLFNTLAKGNLGYDEKQKLLRELIAINPQYLGALTQENIKTKEGLDILDNYILKLREANAVKAKNQLIQEKELRLQQLENDNNALKNKGDIGGNAFLDIGAGLGIGKGSSGFQFMQNLQEADQIKKDLDNLYASISEKTKETVNAVAAGNDGITKATVRTIATIKEQIKALDDAYEKIDIIDSKGLRGNRNERNALQRELDRLEGRKSPEEKKFDNEYDRLKKDYEKFQKDLQKMRQQASLTNEDAEAKEVAAITAKYEELMTRARDFYIKHVINRKTLNEEEIQLEEDKYSEILKIHKKYEDIEFKKKNSELYETNLARVQKEAEQERQLQLEKYSQGLIDGDTYAKALTDIDRRETAKRIAIHQVYATIVDKAGSELVKDKTALEKSLTEELLNQAKAREKLTELENEAKRDLKAVALNKGGPDGQRKEQIQQANNEKEQRIAALRKEMQEAGDVVTDELLKQSPIYEKIMNDYNAKIADANRKFWDDIAGYIRDYGQVIQNVWGSINDFIKAKEDKALAEEKRRNEIKKNEYKKQLDSKLLSKTQYDKKVEQADAELDKKVKEIQREQAKREKALKLFNAVINVAAGIAASLAYGGPVGIALAIATGLAGALQVAAITNEPLPELGTGYWLKTGPKHREVGKGTTVRIERDEAVMSANAMTDSRVYSVTGTTAQITSALNSRNGGASWATGARVGINPDMPKIMAGGGLLGQTSTATGSNNIELLLSQLVSEQQRSTITQRETLEAVSNWKLNSKAWVSIKEYREQEKLYDDAKRVSAL